MGGDGGPTSLERLGKEGQAFELLPNVPPGRQGNASGICGVDRRTIRNRIRRRKRGKKRKRHSAYGGPRRKELACKYLSLRPKLKGGGRPQGRREEKVWELLETNKCPYASLLQDTAIKNRGWALKRIRKGRPNRESTRMKHQQATRILGSPSLHE